MLPSRPWHSLCRADQNRLNKARSSPTSGNSDAAVFTIKPSFSAPVRALFGFRRCTSVSRRLTVTPRIPTRCFDPVLKRLGGSTSRNNIVPRSDRGRIAAAGVFFRSRADLSVCPRAAYFNSSHTVLSISGGILFVLNGSAARALPSRSTTCCPTKGTRVPTSSSPVARLRAGEGIHGARHRAL